MSEFSAWRSCRVDPKDVRHLVQTDDGSPHFDILYGDSLYGKENRHNG